MANHIYIFCSSAAAISAKEIGHYMATIGLLDEKPVFEPTLDSAEGSDPQWTYLKITYKANKRPIQLHRTFDAQDMAPAIEDALAAIAEHCPKPDDSGLTAKVEACRQILHFELGLELTDDCWEALDATQAYVAEKLQGIVFASNGFYDADLEPICTWG